MKRWPILALAFVVLFAASVTRALAPEDLLPGEVASALAAPRPLESGEVDRTGYIKGVYVSAAALTSADFIARMQHLLDATELNAVVIDFKSDRGYLSFPTEVPIALDIGADKSPAMTDPTELLAWFKQRNVYLIARIVTFKDNLLANAYPTWAVTDAHTGGVWHDHEGMGWVDGMLPGPREYNVQLAREAAAMGFDEVQFDYVRFPTDGNVAGATYSQPSTSESRTAALVAMFSSAKAALQPTGTKVAADVFGYTAWVEDDLGIGQHVESIAPFLDVIAPMDYPSTFNAGMPGEDPMYRNAVAYPYEILLKSTQRTVKRASAVNPAIAVRPWLQDFQDYAFDGRTYTPAEIRLQMQGAYDGGARGWFLWDPAVRYTQEALVTAQPYFTPDARGAVPVLAYREPAGAATDAGIAQQSADALRSDLDWLREQGFYPASLGDLVTNGLRSVPAGKRPVVLTFDGASPSQFRLEAGGAVDATSTVGVLRNYSAAHPADWPLRGTFFVNPGIEGAGGGVFGSPDLTEFKLQTLRSWGLEVAIEMQTAEALDQLPADGVREALGQAQQRLTTWLPDESVRFLALPGGTHPKDRSVLLAGAWSGGEYQYQGAVMPAGGLCPSPRSAQFDPFAIPRIPAGFDAGSGWRGDLTRRGLFVSAGE